MLKRMIYHIDINSAFLSWEAVYRLAHKGGTQDLRIGQSIDHMCGGISMPKDTLA